MIYQKETWKDFWKDAESLFLLHDEELNSVLDEPYEINIELFTLLEHYGNLNIQTAREDNKLIGYSIFYETPNLRSKSTKTATQGPWFVRLEKRKTLVGPRLLLNSLTDLYSLGVKSIYLHHYPEISPKIEKFFNSLKADKTEIVYHLSLEK